MFYDGHCALRHGVVRWALAEIKADSLRFAPLQGQQFQVVAAERKELREIDSVVVATDGGYFVTSDAVIRLLLAAGGIWAVLGFALRLIPRGLRDAAYRAVAKIRYRVFGKKAEVCPLLPSHLRDRFILDMMQQQAGAR